MCSQVTPSLNGHLLLLSLPAWGCLRPLCAFAAKAVQERNDIVITFMTFGNFEKRIEAECNRYIPRDGAGLKSRIRLINIGGEGFGALDLIPAIYKAFPDYYAKLVRCEPVMSKSTGISVVSSRPPTVAIVDYIYLPIMQAIRAVSGKEVQILSWYSGNASFMLRIFGPEKFGGLGNRLEKAHSLAGTTGKNVDELAKEMMSMTQGELVCLPGLAPFYDYEWYPYPEDIIKDLPATSFDVFKTGHQFVEDCDGFIYTSSDAYEPEAINATRQWLRESGNRPLYAIGPILPPGVGLLSSNITSSLGMETEDCTPFNEFMNKILNTHGRNSLIYISFGSMWWPRGEYVKALVEVLLKHHIPFIFATASPYSDLPMELVEKVLSSDFAMISKWCPQQMIFAHPVTGWVLTHCGQNTVQEALARGKPLIAWPITFDQPANSSYLSLSLDVAFELIQVRMGKNGLKPLYRECVQPVGTVEAMVLEVEEMLQRVGGEEGAKKRRNAEEVGDRFRRAWEVGGTGLEDFKRLLQDVMKDVEVSI